MMTSYLTQSDLYISGIAASLILLHETNCCKVALDAFHLSDLSIGKELAVDPLGAGALYRPTERYLKI